MKKALLVAAPYPAPYYLEEIFNDLNDWQRTLRDYRGFGSITMVTTAQATQLSPLLSQLNAFCAGLVEGDSAAIVMAGHGARVPDQNGDEADGYDECYVTSDLQALRDDLIGQSLSLAPAGTKIDLVQEICYAGTADRAPAPDQLKLKSLPKKKVVKTAVPTYHRAWQACGEGQLSYGVTSGGVKRSIFSLYLCWALRAYPAHSATSVYNVVKRYVTAAIPAQVPVLSGPNLDAVPF